MKKRLIFQEIERIKNRGLLIAWQIIKLKKLSGYGELFFVLK